MIVYLFTGTRALLPRHWPVLITGIKGIAGNVPVGAKLAFISGMQYGVDTAAAGLAYELYPGARHILVKPAAPCNGALPGLLPKAEVVHVPKGATAGASYRARDQRMVDLAAELGDPMRSGDPLKWLARCQAYPLRPEGSQRYSGTWLTVRMWRALAAKQGHLVAPEIRLLEPPAEMELRLAEAGATLTL